MSCSTWDEPGQRIDKIATVPSQSGMSAKSKARADAQARLKYAVHFQDFATEQQDILQNLITSEKAHLHLIGDVNRQNCRKWLQENDCFFR
ncbi:hypothetical protein TNCV_357421 [Trichonephila clavipes]|nr:hypothetical protein TNCV_357421 [Trichonephila clavipes]